MYVKVNGGMVYLWRAVDQEGEVLESYVTKTCDRMAALTFMKKALKRHGPPETITTDGLRTYGAAMDELGNRAKQDIGRWANNRVENSHLPFDDESEPCCASDKLGRYRNSHPYTPTSTTTSHWNATSSIDRPIRRDAQQRWLSGSLS